jgi:hypothetical protein
MVHSENSARVMSSAGDPADDAPLPAFSAGKIDAANGILSLSWGLEAVRVPGKASVPRRCVARVLSKTLSLATATSIRRRAT